MNFTVLMQPMVISIIKGNIIGDIGVTIIIWHL